MTPFFAASFDFMLDSKMTLLFLLVCFLSCFAVKSTAQNCQLDLRKILSVTSNSTCGDTPPYQCSTPTPHNPDLVLDGSNATWWESANGEQPVRMSLSSDVRMQSKINIYSNYCSLYHTCTYNIDTVKLCTDSSGLQISKLVTTVYWNLFRRL